MLTHAKKEIAVTDSRAANLFNYAFVDRNCHITVKTKDDRYLKFNSMTEFDRLLDFAEDTWPPDLSAWKVHQKHYDNLYDNHYDNLHRIKDLKGWLKDEEHVYVGVK